MMNSCCCCVVGAADKDLTTPYTYFGKTEIYSHMFKECFDLQLTLGDGECGICSPCVGRLRDASDFKVQVQRSQAELQARLQGACHVKEEPAEKSETEEDGTIDEPVLFEPEISLKEEPCWDAPSDGDAGMYTDEIKFEIEIGPEQASIENVAESTHTAIVKPEPISEPERILVQEPLSNMRSTSSHTRVTHELYTSDITPYECGICGAKFKRLVDLSLHVSTVHRKKPVPNTLRRKIPEKTPELTTNSETQKKGKKTYVCNIYSMIYAKKTGLTIHKQTHGKRVYSCEICKMVFKNLDDFEDHIRTHTGEKPFTCDECNRKFRSLSNMSIHKRSHCGEKPYSCKICAIKFRTSAALKRHSTRHPEVHKCHTCEKIFGSSKALKCHKSKCNS